jgi:phosphoglycolate phosphatase-like HAD superfamily hydrolase
MIENCIFDIDGTLIDSNDFHAESWVRAFNAYGKTISFKRIRSCIGMGADQLLPQFLNKKELKEFGEEIGELCGTIFTRNYLAKVQPFPKVRMLFKKIRDGRGRIALASSSDSDKVKRYMKIAHIEDLVEKSSSADDARRSKPSPDIFQAALKLLGNPELETVLVIGDSPYDMLAAKNAKLPALGVLCGGFSKRILQTAGGSGVYRNPAELLKNWDAILTRHNSSK